MDCLHTEVPVSMGEPKEAWVQRIGLLGPCQVNTEVVQSSDSPRVELLHCPPSKSVNPRSAK